MALRYLFNESGTRVMVEIDSPGEAKALANGYTLTEDPSAIDQPKEEAPVENAPETEPEPVTTPAEKAPAPDSDQPMELTDENLIAAVAYCMDPQHSDRLTKAGKPEVSSMEQFLDTEIDAKIRDRALKLYVAAQNQG